MRAVAVLAVLAACGGKSAPQTAEPEVVAPPPEAAAPPPTAEQHLAELADLATRACACADAACGVAVDGELATLIREVPVPADMMDDAGLRAGMDSLGRYLECLAALGVAPERSFHDAYIDRLTEVEAAMCACQDTRCTDRAFGGLGPEVVAIEVHLAEDEALRASRAPFYDRIEACLKPISDAVSGEAIAELTVLRDQACACADAACADRVQADFDAFLMKHRDTTGSQEAAETIGRVAGEMSACLDAARGAAPP